MRLFFRLEHAVSIANAGLVVGLVGLVSWRCWWLASAVPDTTHWADAVVEKVQAQQSAGFSPSEDQLEGRRISFAVWERHPDQIGKPFSIRGLGTDIWDDDLPVWITPGRDGQPGWANWDDNGNGVVDDEGELGAAWSDDFCVVVLPGDPTPAGRILDRGGFRPLSDEAIDSQKTAKTRQRFAITE